MSLFPDRVEVSSPGGLPAGLSEEEYLAGRVSVLRNPILADVFFRLGLIENPILNGLIAKGLVVAEGKGRARRYYRA